MWRPKGLGNMQGSTTPVPSPSKSPRSGKGVWVFPVKEKKNFLTFFFFFWWGPFLKSLLSLLQHYLCFMFWVFGCEACEILAPLPGMESAPAALEDGVLTTGPPKKSQRNGFKSVLLSSHRRRTSQQAEGHGDIQAAENCVTWERFVSRGDQQSVW